MAKDFYLKAAKAQHQALQSERAQTLAELEAAKQAEDKWSAGQAIQKLSDIAAAEQNLTALANQYLASQQPPRELTQEERQAKSWDKMNYNDVYEMTKQTSPLGVDDAAFQRGIEEVKRRRARGE
jgi:hypothetical protein